MDTVIDLGRVVMVPKGAYNAETSYEYLDIVGYEGSSYICKQASTGHLPTDTTYWALIAEKGETGPQGSQGPAGSISAGDGSALTAAFTEASTLDNVTSGESLADLFGKIKKFFNVSSGHNHDGSNSKQIAYTSVTGTPTIREVLTANRTYYVRTDGNNSNTGLINSAEGAFLTIQKAVDTVATLDANGKTITIQVGDGTYNEGVVLKNVIGAVGTTSIVLRGNSTNPENVVINNSSGDAISAAGLNSIWYIRYLKVTSSRYGINVSKSYVLLGNIDFGLCIDAHVICSLTGLIEFTGDYKISGATFIHINASSSSCVNCYALTVTITDDMAINYFAHAELCGLLRIYGNTYDFGSYVITGAKFKAKMNGVINTSNGGANYLPGSSAGIEETGGQYV